MFDSHIDNNNDLSCVSEASSLNKDLDDKNLSEYEDDPSQVEDSDDDTNASMDTSSDDDMNASTNASMGTSLYASSNVG